MKFYKDFKYLGLIPLFLFLQHCSDSNNSPAASKDSDSTAYYTVEDYKSVEKFDCHVHITSDIDTVFIKQGEEDHFRLLNINVYSSTGRPVADLQEFAIRQERAFPGRIAYAAAFSLKDFNKDDWQKTTIDYLKNSFLLGAIAVKVHKNIGMELKDKNGQLVMIDNPRFDTILHFMAQNKIPLIGHLGEHKNSWLPLDKMTVKGNRDYARAHPEHHMFLHPDRPSYEYYIQVRDHMLEKNPDLKFIGAHLGSLEWSVDELAKRLDKFPNIAVDMAERISHLQYQALTNWQKVHDFFIKYQDRVIYGTDLRSTAQDIVDNKITDPASIQKHAHEVWFRHWKFFTTEEKMRVPKVEGEFKGLKLPREVIDKIYFKNAVQWYPGLKKLLGGTHD
jgi:predicted TIM-barrel fold metal-dependent hydrolase